ncbi:portal protein [Nautilia sp. PV-1]|uniref:NAD-binding protein n=1 Tax=Nautilia sp. PV-1 TaxID=2579250 RepID=UPI000FDA5749|nr:NAD-binding protein [Nautilia sp. PV-1]AZV45932.1 portal protein [Nautilia sp. PV-1]
MNILIAGAGKVGYNVAKALSHKHNVVIIDKNEKALEILKETLDVMTICADLRDSRAYMGLEEKFDFFIAVTNNDEINLISTIVTENLIDIENTIVRLTNTSYISTNFQKLNINRLIFPYKLSATAVAKLIEFPKANNIKEFPFNDFILLSLTVQKPEIDKVSAINDEDVIVIGVQRGEEFLFLNEEDYIEEEDLLYILGEKEKLKNIINKLDTVSPEVIQNVLIYGANPLGIEIAKILISFNLNVKILEKDEAQATIAAELLGEEAMVINSSYEDEEMIINEGLHYSDIAIAASLKDESNIIKSLQAKKLGIKKIITINNNLNYYSLMHSLKLSTIRGPKIAAYYEILEEIDSRLLIYERFFLGAKGKIFIKQIFQPKKVTPPKENNKTLIIRNDRIIELKDKMELEPNDIVMEFNFSGNRKWIEAL